MRILKNEDKIDKILNEANIFEIASNAKLVRSKYIEGEKHIYETDQVIDPKELAVFAIIMSFHFLSEGLNYNFQGSIAKMNIPNVDLKSYIANFSVFEDKVENDLIHRVLDNDSLENIANRLIENGYAIEDDITKKGLDLYKDLLEVTDLNAFLAKMYLLIEMPDMTDLERVGNFNRFCKKVMNLFYDEYRNERNV